MDIIVHAGDIVSMEVVDFLSRKNLHAVHGNMDPADIKHYLPRKKVIQLEKFRIGLIHGGGASAGLEERVRGEFRDVDVIVYGHSHQAVNQMRMGVLMFNPGTATGYTYSGIHTLGLLKLDATVKGDVIPL